MNILDFSPVQLAKRYSIEKLEMRIAMRRRMLKNAKEHLVDLQRRGGTASEFEKIDEEIIQLKMMVDRLGEAIEFK